MRILKAPYIAMFAAAAMLFAGRATSKCEAGTNTSATVPSVRKIFDGKYLTPISERDISEYPGSGVILAFTDTRDGKYALTFALQKSRGTMSVIVSPSYLRVTPSDIPVEESYIEGEGGVVGLRYRDENRFDSLAISVNEQGYVLSAIANYDDNEAGLGFRQVPMQVEPNSGMMRRISRIYRSLLSFAGQPFNPRPDKRSKKHKEKRHTY